LPSIVPLTFYQDCEFSGNHQTYQLLPLDCFNLPTNWATLISGINVSSNICYIVYNNPNCDFTSAYSQRYCGPISSFCYTPFNDNVRSLIIA
ncbi:22702_t:CDS:1, partial [Gigaspora rosea]